MLSPRSRVLPGRLVTWSVVDLFDRREDEVEMLIEAVEGAPERLAPLHLHEDPLVQALLEHVHGLHRGVSARPGGDFKD